MSSRKIKPPTKAAKPEFKLNPGQLIADNLFANPELRHICVVGGSRSGKTFFTVRAIVTRALRGEDSRHAILRYRANAARQSIWLDTLPKVLKVCFPQHRFKEHRQDGYWEGPNGSQIWIGGLDDKERVEKILGNEYATIFLNECSQISYSAALLVRTRLAQQVPGLTQRFYYDLNPVGKMHWTNQLFGLKKDPVDSRALENPEQFERIFLNPEQNKANLSEEYLKELRNASERHRKRFYEGVYVDEVEGALWSYEQIAKSTCDIEDCPEFVQTIVSIDPSGAFEVDKTDIDQKPLNDETGIIVASLGKDQRVYMRKDMSCSGGPVEWAKAAIAAYHEFGADTILAEANYGGGMVEAVIRAQDGTVPVRIVRASTGKHVRAEPVSTLYTRDRIRHVGKFPKLEDQLCAFTSLGYGGSKSPDRADAWIWAVTELILSNNGNSWIEYYRRLNEQQGTLPEQQAEPQKPNFGFEITPKSTDNKERVRVPEGITTLYLMDGSSLLVPEDRIVEVSRDDAVSLGQRGYERLAI